jgi:hypothetical protein
MDPVLIALAIGGAIFLLSGKKKKSSTVPPDNTVDPEVGPGGDDRPSGGGGTSGGTAPQFPGARNTQERSYINAVYTEWLGALGTAMDANGNSGPATMDEMRTAKRALGIPSSKTPRSWYADEGLKSVYGMNKKIGTGQGWQPWADAWTRMYNDFSSRPLDPTQ